MKRKLNWLTDLAKGIFAIIVILAVFAVRREWETGNEEMRR